MHNISMDVQKPSGREASMHAFMKSAKGHTRICSPYYGHFQIKDIFGHWVGSAIEMNCAHCHFEFHCWSYER